MRRLNYLSGQTHKQTLITSLQQQALRLKELDRQLAVKQLFGESSADVEERNRQGIKKTLG